MLGFSHLGKQMKTQKFFHYFLASAFLSVSNLALAIDTMFYEDFSTAIPGTYDSDIPGAGFTVTKGNIDIVGQLNGDFYTCHYTNENCIDLVGNQGNGAITSISNFNLVAGITYNITFGYNCGKKCDFKVRLGKFSKTFSSINKYSTAKVSYTPLANEQNALVSFEVIKAPNLIHGPVIDHIKITNQILPASIDKAWITPAIAKKGQTITINAHISGYFTKINELIFVLNDVQVATLTDSDGNGIWTAQYKVTQNPGYQSQVKIFAKDVSGAVIAGWPGFTVAQ